MVCYPNVQVATLINRDNRFIARCLLESGEEVRVHVKNTGRCKELLIPGVNVSLSYQASPTRKTDYDLVAVEKKGKWINIDSQVPNQLAAEGIQSGEIILPFLKGNITEVRREVTYGASRFDICVTTDQAERVFVEVKGMTLEHNKKAAFPDAPSERALKHVTELSIARAEGYLTAVLFIIQLEEVELATIHEERQPKLQQAIEEGHEKGLEVLAYNCKVTPETIVLKESIPVDLAHDFVEALA